MIFIFRIKGKKVGESMSLLPLTLCNRFSGRKPKGIAASRHDLLVP